MQHIHLSPCDKIYLAQFSTVIGKQLIFIPYSAGCIWSYAEQNATVTRSQLGNIFFIKKPIEEILDQLDDPKLFGFSHYIWNEKYNDLLAQEIKQRWPDCRIVYGGPQVPDRMSDWYVNHPFVDVCVHQEGEVTFNQLLRGDLLSSIPGITYQASPGNWIKTQKSQRITDLSDLQSPYLLGLFDNLTFDGYTANAIMETDRGCPYQCTYCDWGGTTFSKIKKLNLERIFEEIEWAGKNKIELVLNANANFGIFKERDEMIVDKVIETKKKYGFPKLFDVCWAKNSNEHVLDLADKLHKNQLLKRFNISLQTSTVEVLTNVKRDNLKINSFTDLVHSANEKGIAVAVELILGLPGETSATWVDTLSKLMVYNNIVIDVNPCWILHNSELNSPDSLDNFGIVTEEVNFSTSIDNRLIQERALQVIQTKSMPQEDMQRAWGWTWCAMLGHTYGITQDICTLICKETGISIREFYDCWFDYVNSSSGIINSKFVNARQYLLVHDYNEYIKGWDHLDDIGHLRRADTIADLTNFISQYWPTRNASEDVINFDMMYYNPDYVYPMQFNDCLVTHPGMQTIKKYSTFIGITRQRRGWRCSSFKNGGE